MTDFRSVLLQFMRVYRCFLSRLASCVPICAGSRFQLEARKIASLKLQRRHIFRFDSIESKSTLSLILNQGWRSDGLFSFSFLPKNETRARSSITHLHCTSSTRQLGANPSERITLENDPTEALAHSKPTNKICCRDDRDRCLRTR